MDLRTGILQTAQALGIDPLDLATVISYETGGTFDPTKRGPTTQWGQHRGLIQFGEPQARQYGVDWNDPLGSQLGPDGAVAKYLRGSGLKPGMGMLDLYSTINAGAPGLYERSDANNGGAPGTVRDKVEQQMSGHRQKAAALLGQEWTPTHAGPAPQQPATGGQPMRAPMVTTQGEMPPEEQPKGLLGFLTPDRRDRLIMGLEGMTLNPNQALMQQAGQAIQGRREEKLSKDQRNKTADWLESQGRTDLAEAVRSGSIGGRDALGIMMQQPEQQKGVVIGGKLVNPVTGQVIGDYGDAEDGRTALQKNYEYALSQGMTPEEARAWVQGGTNIQIDTGDKSSMYGDAPTGTVWAFDDNGQHIMEAAPDGTMRPKVVPLGGSEAEKRAAEMQMGGKQAQAAAVKAGDTVALIDSIMNDPALEQVTGMVQGRLPPFTQAGTDLVVKIEQLQGKAFLEAFESLKGGGAITEREGQAAQNAMARLQRAQSTEEYRKALMELRSIAARGVARLQGSAGAQSDGFSVTGQVK